MAAAPQTGTCTFRGASGTFYAIDIYISDVVAASVTFDSGSGAGAASETFYTFNEVVYLVDFSIVTGLTDTTNFRVTANGKPTNNVIRYANHLNTLNSRPQLNVGFKAGTRIGGIQTA